MDTQGLLPANLLPLWSGNLLPGLGMQSFAMHVGWALVLAAATAFLLRAFPKPLRLAGTGIAAALQLLPAAWSPGWWLGLAFQSPSLTMQGICMLYLVRVWRQRDLPPVATLDTAAYARWPTLLLLVTTIIGWVFVLDMVAVFAQPIHAVGFTPMAVLASLLLASVFELWSMRSGHPPGLQRFRDIAGIIVGAMLIHLIFRLPDGNAWSALMDPWLWLLAQAALLYRALAFVTLLVRSAVRKAVGWATSRSG